MTFQFVTLTKDVPATPVRQSFMEAWNDMYLYVDRCINERSMSYQELETALWIDVHSDSSALRRPIFFYDAIDKAIEEYNWQAPK